MALAGIAVDDADNSSNGLGGGMSVSGTVIITGSTFNADDSFGGNGIGGAIDSGDGYGAGTGSMTVIDSTFSNDASTCGGAISSGIGASNFGGGPGGGSVTVIGSTFFGDSSGVGGAIDSGHYPGGGGTVSVTASTFVNNEGRTGGAISNGRNGGGGTVSLAGDVFGASCDQEGGTWNDGGYNAAADASCFAAAPGTGDLNAGSVDALGLGFALLGDNGGPTQTVLPQASSPVVGLIPANTSVNVGGSPVTLCPATDQRGYASAGGACDAGVVQTTGAVGLTLADSSPAPRYRQAGDVISYNYQVTNTGTTALDGIAIADPAVPGASCPDSTLAPGAAETCTGSYPVTAADVTADPVGQRQPAAVHPLTRLMRRAVVKWAAYPTPIREWPALNRNFRAPIRGCA